jgi:hypothetical protein
MPEVVMAFVGCKLVYSTLMHMQRQCLFNCLHFGVPTRVSAADFMTYAKSGVGNTTWLIREPRHPVTPTDNLFNICYMEFRSINTPTKMPSDVGKLYAVCCTADFPVDVSLVGIWRFSIHD